MKVKLLRRKKKSFLTCFCHFNKTSLPNNKKSLGCKVKECSVVAISPPHPCKDGKMFTWKCQTPQVCSLELWQDLKKTTVERLQSWQQSTGALYQASERQIFQAGGYFFLKRKATHITRNDWFLQHWFSIYYYNWKSDSKCFPSVTWFSVLLRTEWFG